MYLYRQDYLWDSALLQGDGVDEGGQYLERSAIQTTTYAYNGLGDRLAENDTHFVLDLNASLTQVLQDGTQTYLYGNGRIAQQSASGTAYFLGDALGSLRQLVDASGAVTLTKSYEPYGERLKSSGSGSSEYGFTGELDSASTNLLYLRARYYDYSTGRFLTRDTWQGDGNKPLSYNSWLYVSANPINWVDPSGYCQGSNCFEPTPTPPGYQPTPPTPTPTTQRVPPPPGQVVRSIPAPASTADYDGYLTGWATIKTSPWNMMYHLNTRMMEQLGKNGCHAVLYPNGQVVGEEIVYDFVHLQKATFKYNGVVAIPFSIAQAEKSFYEGMTTGFVNSVNIRGYEGFSMSIGADIQILDLVGAGGAINLPMDANGRDLISGVSSLTWNVNIGYGAGLSLISPLEASVSISYYELAGEITNFNENENRTHAALAMIKDLNRVFPKTPGLDLAVRTLYYRETGKSLSDNR